MNQIVINEYAICVCVCVGVCWSVSYCETEASSMAPQVVDAAPIACIAAPANHHQLYFLGVNAIETGRVYVCAYARVGESVETKGMEPKILYRTAFGTTRNRLTNHKKIRRANEKVPHASIDRSSPNKQTRCDAPLLADKAHDTSSKRSAATCGSSLGETGPPTQQTAHDRREGTVPVPAYHKAGKPQCTWPAPCTRDG